MKKTVLVFCEGQRTEPEYVQALRKLPKIASSTSVDIRISEQHGGPRTLVDNAIQTRRTDPEIDECWCLFDGEWPQHHPYLMESISRASAADGVYVAVSNPCFEIWLLMHYTDVTAFMDTDEAVRRSKLKDGRQGKGIDAAAYMPLRAEASRRAKALDARHRTAGTLPPEDNPSSGMYKFLDAISAPLTRQA